MIEVHLYGKLRRFAGSRRATSASIAFVACRPGDTVGDVAGKLGIPLEDLGSNIFLNGVYASLESPVQNTDRLGLFPDDMQLLYKWYFDPKRSDGPEK
ncbi:hypothetical protein JW848_05530 [Candidatus Bipolaricaulota bacterium]|nr:hypothetical protein [Candidatus Bipolaricaulota bacterium]